MKEWHGLNIRRGQKFDDDLSLSLAFSIPRSRSLLVHAHTHRQTNTQTHKHTHTHKDDMTVTSLEMKDLMIDLVVDAEEVCIMELFEMKTRDIEVCACAHW